MRTLILFLVFLLSNVLICQNTEVQLPTPTGKHDVGIMQYEWMDASRELSPGSIHGDKRVLPITIAYPASVDTTAQVFSYKSGRNDSIKVTTNSYLRPKLSESVEHAELIIIAPGRGTRGDYYTILLEELVSHGFVVMVVNMPLIGNARYLEGYRIPPSNNFRPPPGMMGGPYEKVDAFFETPTKIGTADLEFAYEMIKELNANDPNSRFTGRINVSKVGVFGHSLGGRIAANFASRNEEVKALIAMEGIAPRNIRYNGLLKIPVAMLCSSGTWPYAKVNYMSLIDHRNELVHMFLLPEFDHNSGTDLPVLYPDNYLSRISPVEGTNIFKHIVNTFFTHYMRREDKREALQMPKSDSYKLTTYKKK